MKLHRSIASFIVQTDVVCILYGHLDLGGSVVSNLWAMNCVHVHCPASSSKKKLILLEPVLRGWIGGGRKPQREGFNSQGISYTIIQKKVTDIIENVELIWFFSLFFFSRIFSAISQLKVADIIANENKWKRDLSPRMKTGGSMAPKIRRSPGYGDCRYHPRELRKKLKTKNQYLSIVDEQALNKIRSKFLDYSYQ